MENKIQFKAVLKQEDLAYYVSDAEIIRFISENAPMPWNKCCSFVRDVGITSESSSGGALWERKDVMNNEEEYNSEQIKWMKLFFKAHPFIDKVMFVFDD